MTKIVPRPSHSFLGASGRACPAPTPPPGRGEACLALAPLAIAFTAALLLAPGCGYHVSGHGDLMPKTIKTIAIPAFGNVTTRYQLARLLPADITREFLSRTHYAIVADPNQADAVLAGTVTNFAFYPTVNDPVSGRATAAQAVVTLRLTLTDRATQKVLFSRLGAEFRERYEISIDPTAYFDESGTAMQRVSRDVARSVVAAILEGF
jgi:hypothetical protein